MIITIGDFVRFVPPPRGFLHSDAPCKTDQKYCVVNTMARWGEEGTLLEVVGRIGDKVTAGQPGKCYTYAFDVSDLEFVPPKQGQQRQFWFVVDGSIQATSNSDLPEIVFTRVTRAGSYAEAIDMFQRDLYDTEVYCINADHLSEATARSYLVENRTTEQYYVSVDGHENIAISIPVNDS